MTHIVVVTDEQTSNLETPDGLSLMEALRDAGVGLVGECEGSLACSSCHVWIDEDWYGKLPQAGAEEEDLLDVTFNLTPTSRLSCQVRISPELDGLRCRIPKSTS